jgi:hypothetical protein
MPNKVKWISEQGIIDWLRKAIAADGSSPLRMASAELDHVARQVQDSRAERFYGSLSDVAHYASLVALGVSPDDNRWWANYHLRFVLAEAQGLSPGNTMFTRTVTL